MAENSKRNDRGKRMTTYAERVFGGEKFARDWMRLPNRL